MSNLYIVTQEGKGALRGALMIIEARNESEAIRKFKKTRNYSSSRKDGYAPVAALVEDGYERLI